MDKAELDKTFHNMLVFESIDMLKEDLKLTKALEVVKALRASSFLEVRRLKVNFLVWDFLDFIAQQFERVYIFLCLRIRF